MPSDMERKLVRCFRCCQLGHYAYKCSDLAFAEDYAPICGNHKQLGHTTNECNAPFNFNNRNQQMQPSNFVEDKTRTLQDSLVNSIEVVCAVQTREQRNSKDQPIQQKELNVKEKSIPVPRTFCNTKDIGTPNSFFQ